MDEDISVINSNSRNEKVRNYFLKNKNKIISTVLALTIILIAAYSYDKHKTNQKKEISKASFLTSSFIGIATGMIPCPTVIVAYLSGVSTGNTYVGLQSVTYFALGMFLALMLVVIAFNFGGQKVIDRFKDGKLSNFNWGYVQGSLFIIIGVFTAVLH